MEVDLYSLPPDHFNKTIYEDASNEQVKGFFVPSDSARATKTGKPRSRNGPHAKVEQAFPEKNVTTVAHRGGEMKRTISHTKQDYGYYFDCLSGERCYEGGIQVVWSGNDIADAKRNPGFTGNVTQPTEVQLAVGNFQRTCKSSQALPQSRSLRCQHSFGMRPAPCVQ